MCIGSSTMFRNLTTVVSETKIGRFGRGFKPRHRNTLMDKKRLDYYKKKLLARREELLRDIARNQQEGREADEDPTVDLADKAANSYTKEFLFGQTHSDRALLQLVDDALARIKVGSFGECVSCHEELQQKRLEAVPWTQYCISCQEKKEKGLL
jgi:DnaK suppressor protein